MLQEGAFVSATEKAAGRGAPNGEWRQARFDSEAYDQAMGARGAGAHTDVTGDSSERSASKSWINKAVFAKPDRGFMGL